MEKQENDIPLLDNTNLKSSEMEIKTIYSTNLPTPNVVDNMTNNIKIAREKAPEKTNKRTRY